MTQASYPSLHMLIDGKRISAGATQIDVLDPSNGNRLGSLPLADEKLLGEAVDAAAAAQKEWRNTAARDRAAILAAAARSLRSRAEEIAIDLVRENGKPLAEARLEIMGSADILDWFAEEAKRAYGRTIPSRQLNSRLMTLREPVGVVALFMAWNYPATNFVRKVAPALAAGCAIVAKPSEETPATPLAIAHCLEDAGLPAGVLNVVFGDPPTVSEYLIPHPLVRKISFTGSTQVGRKLAQLAGAHLKRTTMELGGHAPLIIAEDVDVESVARAAAGFKFRNAGQICTSPTRFYVHEKIKDKFVSHFADIAMALNIGCGLDSNVTMGPLTHAGRQSAMQAMVADAIAGGGKLVCGGVTRFDNGAFFEPTVLTDLSPDARILHDEPFGPIVPVIGFSDLEEVIENANATPYGLSAYAFTQSLANAHRLGDTLNAGQVCINNFMPSLPETPAGGFKDSGWGHENGLEGIEPYLQTKFLHEMS